MKKAIIFAVVAFLVSLGGTSAVLVKRGVHAAQVAAQAKADSLAADSTRTHASADSAKGGTAGKSDSATALAMKPAGDSGKSDSVHAQVAGTRPAQAPARGAPPVRPVSISAATPEEKAAAVKQVARVLSAMKAAEAAKVLAYLSDTEVEEIRRAVGPRQAADFLTNLPKERAANLSRRLMTPKEAGR